MSVDMFERRFKQELAKLPNFKIEGSRSEKVWAADFPAWRAIFTALCLWGHSTGYQLPSYERFFSSCKRAYTVDHPHPERFKPYFADALLDGMKHRVGVWYESGMAETYLYVCLVEVIEDKMKKGVVLYDPRADWKLKADLILLIGGRRVTVSSFYGDIEARSKIETRREGIERVRKINTSESSHWGNKELTSMDHYQISRTDSDYQPVNGIRLFSVEAINALLKQVYKSVNEEQGYYFAG